MNFLATFWNGYLAYKNNEKKDVIRKREKECDIN